MGKQVLDISQMQHLNELGVDTSNGSAYWYRIVQHKCDGNIRVISDWKFTSSLDIAYCTGHTLESIRTFTLQDILDLLPNVVISNNKYFKLCIEMSCEKWCIYYYTDDTTELISKDNIYLIDSAYEMLCWVIENGYLKVK